jgi:methyl-accepting chemotaxis protein
MNNETLLLFFVAFTGLAVLLQAIILLALFLSIRKTARSMQEEIESLRNAIAPTATNLKDFLSRVGPRMESLTSDLADVAHDLRSQSKEVQASLNEVLDRVHRQTSRMDAMLTNMMDGVERAGGFVVDAVSLPVRQLSAIAASAKAVIGALRAKNPRPQQTHSPADHDRFI